MTITYPATSPWHSTKQASWFLDIQTPRPITAQSGDQSLVLNAIYNLRPHLLAYDLYQDPSLYWVFCARNPDVIQDPIYDFVTGISIYVTAKEDLLRILNV